MRNKFSKFALLAAFGLALAFTFSCSGDGGSGGGPNTIKKERISGVSQKGPFVEGATVKIYELDANLKEIGNIPFEGKTDDDGNFQIGITNGQLASPYIALEVSGKYVSEVNGQQSTVPITLKAVADVSVKSNVNINVLTHLEYEKVLKLVNSNTKFEGAKKAAQKQVLNALGIDETGIASEDMTLFGGSASDSTLLLASIILQANRSTDDVIGLLAAISNEINGNGTLSNSTKSKIANGVASLDMDDVKDHLPPNAKAPSNDDVSATLQGTKAPSTDVSGTWNASGGRSVIFAGNTFNYKVNNETEYSGTFSVSGSIMTFKLSTGDTASCNFTLSADTFVISKHPDQSVNGTYTKGSGGGSGNTVACKYIYTFEEPINGNTSSEICEEISGSLISQIKQEVKESCEVEVNGTFYNSCPSGYVLKCEYDDDDDYEGTYYFYDSEFRGLSCEEVFYKM